MAVYRTTDGDSLDAEKVIAFFRNALESKGWKEGIFKRQGNEPYLSLRMDMLEDLPDGTRIQLGGELYLWIAARDGMITVFLRQWRNSRMDQDTHDARETMFRRLAVVSSRVGYQSQKAYDTGWARDYENEYLIDKTEFILVPADAKPSMDTPPDAIHLSFVTYRDSGIAEKARTSNLAARRGKTVIFVHGAVAAEKLKSILDGLVTP